MFNMAHDLGFFGIVWAILILAFRRAAAERLRELQNSRVFFGVSR